MSWIVWNLFLWNLFLAVIPAALAVVAARIGRAIYHGRSRWLWLLLAPLLVVWLAFLPNSCYLFTEPRHFLAAVGRDNLWLRAKEDPLARGELMLRAAVGMIYSATGALTFVLSIRPLRRLAREARLPLLLLDPFFFALVSLGVYFGLIRRYNSWDLVNRPGDVVQATAELADRPHLLLALVAFSAVLWAAFTVSDIWIDGFLLRWSAWTGHGAASTASPRARPARDGTETPGTASDARPPLAH